MASKISAISGIWRRTREAIIEQPPASAFDTGHVIKADQFPTWHQKFVDKLGVGAGFKSMLNVRGNERIKGWAEKLLRHHRPADLLALPDFMKAKL